LGNLRDGATRLHGGIFIESKSVKKHEETHGKRQEKMGTKSCETRLTVGIADISNGEHDCSYTTKKWQKEMFSGMH